MLFLREAVRVGRQPWSCKLNNKNYSSLNLYYNLYIIILSKMFTSIEIKDMNTYYSQDSQPRYESLIQHFKQTYNNIPDFIARAPGRVNIIGQHIDYQGYGVLPAAIEKDCLIAVKKNNTEFVQVNHVLSQTYPACKLSKYPSKISSQIKHSYIKYFAAGYRAGIFQLKEEKQVLGLQVLIEGNIPWASGVSSSSAFCVCSALVSNHANSPQSIPKEQFVERCIKFERQVGTASGGMDQSISILGEKDSCLHITFNPIKGSKVNVPTQKYTFIIMNTLVQSAKLNTAVYRYNKRVCQCRIATHLLAKNIGLPKQQYEKYKILKQLQQQIKINLNQMPLVVEKLLPRKQYTQQMLEKQLQIKLIDLLSDIPLAKQVLEANQFFAIFQAAYHVFTEAYRVINFINVCNSDLNQEKKGLILGQLMNQSQDSCKNYYDCSCPEIDEMTKTALQNGAVGSRLTGAGWGGCTVSLVPAEKVTQFIESMKKVYYEKEQIRLKVEKAGVSNVLFATNPTQGACIIKI